MFYDWMSYIEPGMAEACRVLRVDFSMILIIKFTYKPDLIARKHKPQKKILYSLCVFPSMF